MLKKLIPARFHYRLSEIKKALIGGYGRTYYSQFGEDIVVSKLLHGSTGFYVDVGAHHPKRYSNTYLLFKRGWHGINIDANPHTIDLFRNARPRDKNLCIGVGAVEGSLEYYQFSDPAVNTFSSDEARKWMDKDWITFMGKKAVPVLPLAAVLTKEAPIPHINFLSIDVEGMDFDVLGSFDWSGTKPDVIAIESHTFDSAHPKEDKVVSFLVDKHQYALAAHVGPSLIFTRVVH